MKALTYFLFIVLCAMSIQAQEITVTGTVTEESGPLPGVHIFVKGTEAGVSTNFDGYYMIKLKASDTLLFSYVGYKREEIAVNGREVINVILEEDDAMLDEVVITSAAVRREKKAIGYAVSSVSAEMMEGEVSGVHSSSKLAHKDGYNDVAYGQLTAGEINDLEKWSEFSQIYKDGKAQQIAEQWGFDHTNKLEVHIQTKDKSPVANVAVTLYKNNTIVMKGRTDITGSVVLFKGAKTITDRFLVQVYQDDDVKGKSITRSQEYVSFVLEHTNVSDAIDVMFTIDATGSMGDEIAYLKSELKNIMNRIDSSVAQKRVGLTFYRDHGDAYVTREFDFNDNVDLVKNYLAQQNADGGGDYEEAVEEALKVSLSQSWNDNAKTKLLFLLLDAPPHLNAENVATIKEQIRKAQKKGIKIIPIVASDANKQVEFLMRSFSVATNGTYVFLTDDSGIGNDHMEATTKEFEVEKLNDLIVRLIEKYSGIVKDA